MRVNSDVWERGEYVSGYASRSLRPVEVVLFVRYRDRLKGAVVELGCGAGRLTGYIIQLGGSVFGIDLAPKMVAYCRSTYPGGTFEVGDLREVAKIAPSRVDVVVAGNNVIDVLPDEERRRVIASVGEVLGADGLFIMSSHNRGRAPKSPVEMFRNVGEVEAVTSALRVPVWLRNRRRLRRLEIREPGYAILNDEAHDYRLLHYYITRDAQEQQFRELGFELIECLAEDGTTVPSGGLAPQHGELHYVARLAR